jgi:hypothetical protein
MTTTIYQQSSPGVALENFTGFAVGPFTIIFDTQSQVYNDGGRVSVTRTKDEWTDYDPYTGNRTSQWDHEETTISFDPPPRAAQPTYTPQISYYSPAIQEYSNRVSLQCQTLLIIQGYSQQADSTCGCCCVQ